MILVLEIIVGLDMVLDKIVEFADLEFDGFDHFADAFTDFDMVNHRGAIGFLGEQVDELPASGDQFGEGLGFGVLGRFWLGLDDFAEVGEDVGVDGVGLGEAAQAAGEIADLARIGDHDVVAGLDEFGGERFFVAAGGFEHNQGDVEVWQAVQEIPVALTGVEIAAVEVGGPGRDLKRFLCDVDADEKCCGHGVLPFLPMRAWRRKPLAQAAVRVRSTGATRTWLTHGLGDRGEDGLTSPVAAASVRYARLVGSHDCTYGTTCHA